MNDSSRDSSVDRLVAALRRAEREPGEAVPLPSDVLGTAEEVRARAAREARRVLTSLRPSGEKHREAVSTTPGDEVAATSDAAQGDPRGPDVAGQPAAILPMSAYQRTVVKLVAKPWYAAAASVAILLVGMGASYVPAIVSWALMTRELDFASAVRRTPFEFTEDGSMNVDFNIDCRYVDHGVLEFWLIVGDSRKLIFRQVLQPTPLENGHRGELKWQTPTPNPLPVDGSRIEARCEFVLDPSLPDEAKVQLAAVTAPVARQFSVTPSGVLLLPPEQRFEIEIAGTLAPSAGGAHAVATIHSARPGWVAVFVQADGSNRWYKQGSAQRVPENHRLQIDCSFVPGPNLEVPTTFHVAAALFTSEDEPLVDQAEFASSSLPQGVLNARKEVEMAALPYLAFHWTDEAAKRGDVEWRLKPNIAVDMYLWFADDHWCERRMPINAVSGKVSVEILEDITEIILAPAIDDLVQVPRKALSNRVAWARIVPTSIARTGDIDIFKFRTPEMNARVQLARTGETTHLSASGTHRLPLATECRVILVDKYGKVYRQDGPVILDGDGSWSFPNIDVGSDIVRVEVFEVGSSGAVEFDRWEFGAQTRQQLRALNGYRPLASRALLVQGP